MKLVALTTAAALLAAPVAFADQTTYALDSSHSQIVFSYDHLGFSTTYGMFSGFEGTIEFNVDAPETSEVAVSFPVSSMLTGWEARFAHFMSPDFLNAEANDEVTFVSTSIEVTGDDTALITGDLTLNGITKAVTLDTVLNGAGVNPLANKEGLGFDATATV